MLAVVIGLLLIVTVAAGIVAVVAAPRLREGEGVLTTEGKQSLQRAKQQARQQSAAAAGSTVKAAGSTVKAAGSTVKAAGSTVKKVSSLRARPSWLRARTSALWAPFSNFLHQQFDRLEGAPAAPGSREPGQQPVHQHKPVHEGQPRHVGGSGQPAVHPVPRLLPLDPADVELRDRDNDRDDDDLDDNDRDDDDLDDEVLAGDVDHVDDLDHLDGDAAVPAGPGRAGAGSVGRPRPVPLESGPIPEVEGGVSRAKRQPGPDVPAVINLRDLEAGQSTPYPSPDVTTRRRS